MVRRAFAILVLTAFLSSASGFALALHLHDTGHCQSNHQREGCPVCVQLIDGKPATLSVGPAAPSMAEWDQPADPVDESSLDSEKPHSAAVPRGPPLA